MSSQIQTIEKLYCDPVDFEIVGDYTIIEYRRGSFMPIGTIATYLMTQEEVLERFDVKV